MTGAPPPSIAGLLCGLAREIDISARLLGPIETALLDLAEQTPRLPPAVLRRLQGIDRLEQRLRDLAKLAEALSGFASNQPEPHLAGLVQHLRLEELRLGFGLGIEAAPVPCQARQWAQP